MTKEELIAALSARDPRVEIEEKANSAAIKIPAEALAEIAAWLKNDPAFSFDMLLCHTAVHWPAENQIELLYRLYSLEQRHHLLLTTRVSLDNPEIATVQPIWAIAEWQEREVYDLFGVRYRGHPDLRRLLLEDDWQGFPLRKDYKDDHMLGGP